MIEIQRTIFDKLTTDLSVPVYDHVPQAADPSDDSAFPFVTVGEDTFTPFDTDNSIGFTVECTIHVWSRKRGRKETKEIQTEIYNSLHRAELTVTGYHCIGIDHIFADSAMEPDTITRHGVQRFTVLLDEDS